MRNLCIVASVTGSGMLAEMRLIVDGAWTSNTKSSLRQRSHSTESMRES